MANAMKTTAPVSTRAFAGYPLIPVPAGLGLQH
jgi:hypothetical protein